MENSVELQLKIDRKIKELGFIKIIEKCIEKASQEYASHIRDDATIEGDNIIFKVPEGNKEWSLGILKSIIEINKKIPTAYVKSNTEYKGNEIRMTLIYGY